MKKQIIRFFQKSWLVLLLFSLGSVFLYYKNLNNTEAFKQKHFSLQTNEGLYLSADRWENNLIMADKESAKGWEVFTFFYLDSNHVKIRSFYKHFLEINNSGFLIANSQFSDATLFKVEYLSPNKITLKPLGSEGLSIDGRKRVKVDTEGASNISLRIQKEISEVARKEALAKKKYRIHPFYYQLVIIGAIVYLVLRLIPLGNLKEVHIALVPILIFPFLVYRAYNISFVIDEAWSFDILVNQPYYFRALIFDNTNFYIANNHVLNTVFGYISRSLFGISPMSFRLFNLLAFVFYAIYSIRLIGYYSKSNISLLIGTVLVFLNPFVLEFFSLYRGYGLAIAFFTGVLYYFSKLYNSGFQYPGLIRGVIFSVLAVYSNFALLVPVFVIQASYFLYINKKSTIKEVVAKKSTIVFVLSAFLIIPAVSNILILSEQNELYFGGSESFIKNTINSVISYSFNIKNELDSIIVQTILLALFVTALFMPRKRFGFEIFVVIFCLIILSTFLNLVTGSKFVIERASIYLVPLLGIFLVQMYDRSSKNKLYKGLLCGLIIFLSLSAVKKMENTFTMDRTTTWSHDVDNKDILPYICEINGGREFSLAVFWIFNYPMKYYAEYQGITELTSITPMEDEPIAVDADYYYIRTLDLKNVTFNYDVVKEYPDSQTILLRKNG